jgi:hypothetical protein
VALVRTATTKLLKQSESRRCAAAGSRITTIALRSASAPTISERIVDETEDALIKADRGLYQRDGKIVCVDTIAAIAAKGVQVYVQRICERGDHALREDLCAAAVFQKYDARSKGIWGPEGGQARVTWKIVGGGVVSAHRRPKQATR